MVRFNYFCSCLVYMGTVCAIRVLSDQPEKREILDVIASDENRVQFGWKYSIFWDDGAIGCNLRGIFLLE